MTLLNHDTGELMDVMTRAEAEDFVRFMRAAQEQIPRRIIDAYHRRAWIPLGYASWEVMIAAEGLAIRLPRDERQDMVLVYSAAGLSTRAIAPVVGADHATVARDIERATVANATVADDSPRPTPPPVVRTTTGLDGRERTSVTAGSVQKPRRRPLTDVARDAGWDLRKAVERIERIAADDRFTANKDQVAPHLRSHLQYAVEVCQDLLARIDN